MRQRLFDPTLFFFEGFFVKGSHDLIHDNGVCHGSGYVQHGTAHIDDRINGKDGGDGGELGAKTSPTEGDGSGHGRCTGNTRNADGP